MADITHVIHCAGADQGVPDRRVLRDQPGRDAQHRLSGQRAHRVRCSGWCIFRAWPPPDLPCGSKPAREEDPPQPVSEYGKSKLAGELEVRNHCRAEHVILRPPAVYGPRDAEFLRLFRAVKHHLLPRMSGAQALSLVFVKDLAEAVVTCLTHPAAAGKTYFVAGREVVTARRMAEEIA